MPRQWTVCEDMVLAGRSSDGLSDRRGRYPGMRKVE